MIFEDTQTIENPKFLDSNKINNRDDNKTEVEIHRSELKTDNFNMQATVSQNVHHPQLHTSKITIPINNISSLSSTSVNTGTNTSATNINSSRNPATPAINTEEFAKLDALLEDLLAEVEQPILLNKYNENMSQKQQIHQKKLSEENERSEHWLNEQKEMLRSRKEMLKQGAKKVGDTNITYGNTKYVDSESDVPSLNGALNGYMNGISKPPLSPNDRQLYSPQSQQQQEGQSFRSLSTNPALLRNINEIDDEMNMIESEFDRYSQRSFRSNASTVQRSKYHTVSNDFVDVTRPTAPTPVPSSSYSMKRVSNPGKRALSAPPVELGKVMLQRMELKSPVTVRQGSCVPFEQPNNVVQYPYNSSTISNRYVDNGNQVANSYHGSQNLKVNQNMIQYQPQQIPVRNAFINRAYPESSQRVTYTNGYETDSGITNGYSTYGGPGNAYVQQSNIYNVDNVYTPRKANIVNGYRTISGSVSRGYNNEHQGYETDTGLMKLRTSLDNNRRALSRNDLPIVQQQQIVPNGYYYGGRSVTPSFNYPYNQHIQQQRFNNQYTPVPDQFALAYPNEFDSHDIMNTNSQYTEPTGSSQDAYYQPYTEGNNNVTYVTEDGRQIVMTEQEAEAYQQQQNYNATIERQQRRQREYLNSGHPLSQSLVIQQQRAPSAYSMREQITPSRQAYTSSATNVSTQHPQLQQSYGLNGNLSTSQQITKQEQRAEVPRGPIAGSVQADENNEVYRSHPKSVKTTQSFWYKPKISREEAINILKDKQPGTFLIRDSNNFPGAYGLALKVDKPPANVQIKPGSDPLNELVRHFLIEPTTKGVRIKGCYNEPIFGSLAALVYQHSLTSLALPCKLNLPQEDLYAVQNQAKQVINQVNDPIVTPKTDSIQPKEQKSQQQPQSSSVQDARHLLEKGAACHVYYLCTMNVDDKVGLEAISYALSSNKAYLTKDTSQLVVIQFKVTSQGVTLTDINKKKFLRQHFATNTVSFCAIEERMTWPTKLDKINKPRIFGLITKPSANLGNNECHLFVELDPDQPAVAIVDFINRYLIPSKNKKNLS